MHGYGSFKEVVPYYFVVFSRTVLEVRNYNELCFLRAKDATHAQKYSKYIFCFNLGTYFRNSDSCLLKYWRSVC
jgi:hypothetical protein